MKKFLALALGLAISGRRWLSSPRLRLPSRPRPRRPLRPPARPRRRSGREDGFDDATKKKSHKKSTHDDHPGQAGRRPQAVRLRSRLCRIPNLRGAPDFRRAVLFPRPGLC